MRSGQILQGLKNLYNKAFNDGSIDMYDESIRDDDCKELTQAIESLYVWKTVEKDGLPKDYSTWFLLRQLIDGEPQYDFLSGNAFKGLVDNAPNFMTRLTHYIAIGEVEDS